MNTNYPVALDLDHPDRFERTHVVLRFAFLLILGAISAPLGVLLLLAYVLLPLIAAAEISERKDRYLTEIAPRMINVLQVLLDALAYLMLLTDRIPRLNKAVTRFDVEAGGEPTVTSALLRPLYALPEALVLALLGIVAWMAWIFAVLCVLVANNYPHVLFSFLRGMLRWMARVFAYLASLVDQYPPFSLELGAGEPSLNERPR